MSEEKTVEQRLAALEAELAQLKRHVYAHIPPANWMDLIPKIAPENLEAFQEMVEYGRAWRQAQ
jgi:DNA-binding HxlR family transcriptional regulator